MSVETEAPRVATLNHADRCDKCGARAYVVTGFDGVTGELYWCRHDWNDFRIIAPPSTLLIKNELWQLDEHIRDDKHVS